MCTPCMGEAATKRFLMPLTFSTGRSGAEEIPPPRFCFYQPIRADWLLHAVLVRLDHLLDHLAANGTGLTAGQIAIVALLQVDANLLGGLHLELVPGPHGRWEPTGWFGIGNLLEHET